MSTIHLYFVRADCPNGENLDLLVEAENKDRVVAFWRNYYELEEGRMPMFVTRVPLTGKPGPIDWGSLIRQDP